MRYLLPFLFLVVACGKSTSYCPTCDRRPTPPPTVSPAPSPTQHPSNLVVDVSPSPTPSPSCAVDMGQADLAQPDLGLEPDMVQTDMATSPDLSEPDDPECTCDQIGHGKGMGHCQLQHELNSRGHGNGHCKYDCE